MEKLINKLISEIIKLITKADNSNSNELKYQIGELITSFYLDNKKELKGQKQYDWNDIMEKLSDALNTEYKGDGYSLTNLRYMQQFYRKYRNNLDMLENTNRLTWSHNLALLKEKIEENERIYYLNKAVKEKWTVKELDDQIRDEIYEEFLKKIEKNDYYFDIKNITIQNYKSLGDINIANPSKLLIFAGANATGKSSIFEAVEFLIHAAIIKGEIAFDIFEGKERVINFNAQKKGQGILEVTLELAFQDTEETVGFGVKYDIKKKKLIKEFTNIAQLDERLTGSFSRIFIDNSKRAENKLKIHNKLWLDASNLSNILKDVLADEQKKEEIIEWLQILIPEIKTISVEPDFAGKEELKVFEKAYPGKAMTGKLISEGTYNIIALLALCYQSDKPQFICIEEPETGLNPAVLSELIPLFREMSEKYNHHIWITTHSTALVSELTEEELVIVNKKNGITQTYPCKPGDFEEMKPDEAWMSKMLKGGGLPW